MHLPQVFIAREILIRRLQQRALIFIGKSKAGKFERTGQAWAA
jgi:hypothetical protein